MVIQKGRDNMCLKYRGHSVKCIELTQARNSVYLEIPVSLQNIIRLALPHSPEIRTVGYLLSSGVPVCRCKI